VRRWGLSRASPQGIPISLMADFSAMECKSPDTVCDFCIAGAEGEDDAGTGTSGAGGWDVSGIGCEGGCLADMDADCRSFSRQCS
jgi:hypothetical protein